METESSQRETGQDRLELRRKDTPFLSPCPTVSFPSSTACWDKEDPYFRPRGSMPSLVSSSPSSDLSLSVGYFPHDDELSYEDSGSDTSLPYLVPPIQSKWKIENLGRQRGRRQQGEDSPKPFCRQAQNDGLSSERKDTVAMTSCNLYRDAGWGDRKLPGKKQLKLRQMNSLVQKLRTFLENQKSDESTDEDGQVPGSSPVPDLAEQAATKHHVPEQGEAIQFMEEDTTLQGHDLVGVSKGHPQMPEIS